MRRSVNIIGALIQLGTVCFFGFHMVVGERGLLAKDSLDRDILLAREELSLLRKSNAYLSHRIDLMRNGSVDADMLAETARAELGLYSERDVIISIQLDDLKF